MYIWQISVSRSQLVNYIVIWSNIRVTSKMHKSTHITHILVQKKKTGISNNFNKINKTILLWSRGMHKYFFGWMGANSQRLEDLVWQLLKLQRGVQLHINVTLSSRPKFVSCETKSQSWLVYNSYINLSYISYILYYITEHVTNILIWTQIMIVSLTKPSNFGA